MYPDKTTPFPNRNVLEEIIIGSLLQDYSKIHIAQSQLTAEDFQDVDLKMIYEAILQCYHDQLGIDCMTVLNQLRKDGNEKQVGGPLRLVEITDRISSTIHFDHHVRIMKEWILRKQLLELSDVIQVKTFDETADIRMTIDQITIDIGIMSGRLNQVHKQTTSEAISEMVSDMHQGKGQGDDIFDIQSLNQLFSGSLGGDLIVIAGRPGSGKSMLTSNIMHAAINKNETCYIRSLEMTSAAVLKRLISKMTKINYQRMSNNNLSDDERNRIDTTSTKIINANLLLNDNANLSAQDIRSELIQLKMDNDIKTVIIDHGGLLNHINPNNLNSVEEIGNTTKLLKQTAKELNLKIVLLWQLNRQAGGGEIPSLKDLRGSGRIEEDADAVLFIHRPEIFNQASATFEIDGQEYETNGHVAFILAKNRNGSIGSTVCKYEKTTFTFKDINSPF